MKNEIPQQLVWLTEGNAVVAKAVLDLTDDDHARLRNAEATYLQTCQLTGSPIEDEEMQALVEAVDARHLPADDPTSFAKVKCEMTRKAREQREAETKAADREAQRQVERGDYLQPSDRAEAARQLRPNQESVATPAPLARVWTDTELDAMSADDMVKQGIVTRSTRIEDRQGDTGVVLRGERPWERRQPRQRHVKLSPEELEARKYRESVLAHDEAQRQKVKSDIRKALEEQEEKRLNERKHRS